MKGKAAIGIMAILLGIANFGFRIEAAESAPSSNPQSAFRNLQFEDRVFYQERIERVYYNRRTGTKPPFEQAVPREVIEKKVRKYLAQDLIVGAVHEPPFGKGAIHELPLQKELERICRSTKAPDTLRELFAALDNNAYLVKEILVRPILAEKMSRVLYQKDAAFHAPERELAEKILAELQITRGEMMEATARTYDAEYGKYVLRAKDGDGVGAGLPRPDGKGADTAPLQDRAIEVDTDVLTRRHTELKGTENTPKIKGTEEGFIIERLIHANDASLEIESITIRKRTYESWLSEFGMEAESSSLYSAFRTPHSAFPFEPLPPISSSASFSADSFGTDSEDCTADSWIWLGLPGARFAHTAVWTGTEMIVWGGGTAYYYNDGGRYDPATDSWTPTSTVSAPSARKDHRAVWTGTEMIVWGGVSSCCWTYENTGGRYDPVADSWTATTTTGAPAGRQYFTAIWTGTEMIVWGGWGSGSPTYKNDGGRYNPSTNSWTATTTTGAPSARNRHTAVWTGTEMIVWGGGTTNTGGRYNPSSNSWTATTTTDAPLGRENHTAVWTGTRMIVWGGYDGSNRLSTGGRYDPNNGPQGSWTPTTTEDAPSARSNHTAVWAGTRMIVWGGNDGTYANTGGRYDPSADTWTTTSTGTNVPSGRYYHTAVWTGTEMIVWGGYQQTNTGGRYDPMTDMWTATAMTNGPATRSGHAVIWTGSEMVIWGGWNGNIYFNTGWRYDPATDFWMPTTTTDAPSGRTAHTAVWTGTEMIIWGGEGAHDSGCSCLSLF